VRSPGRHHETAEIWHAFEFPGGNDTDSRIDDAVLCGERNADELLRRRVGSVHRSTCLIDRWRYHPSRLGILTDPRHRSEAGCAELAPRLDRLDGWRARWASHRKERYRRKDDRRAPAVSEEIELVSDSHGLAVIGSRPLSNGSSPPKSCHPPSWSFRGSAPSRRQARRSPRLARHWPNSPAAG